MTTSAATLSLFDTDPAELAVDAVVIGVHSPGDSDGKPGDLLLASGAESIAAAFEGRLSATLSLLGATGSVGEVTKLATLGAVTAPLVVAVGLGPEPTGAAPATETLRRAAGNVIRALAGCERVAFALPLSDDEAEPVTPALRALTEGALLGGYRFFGYKSQPAKGLRAPVGAVAVLVSDAADTDAQAELTRAAIVGAAVARTRDWVNVPANQLTPPVFADQVAAAAREAGLDVEVLDEKALREGGYGGIIAVGDGSEAKPRLVRLHYKPENAGTRVALIGKGITFDTGGVSIKPAQGMWEMKSDMSGAAAVASTMIAISALKPAVEVVAYIPMAENMLSGTAYRPGDVVTMRNGKRVEVLNTDAEGRMILGDAMARACEDNPAYLLETSTLTGGQVIALGKKISGLMGTESLTARIKAAGDEVGEPGWPMPLPDEIRKTMESDVADILQVSAGMERSGHMLQGGIFLREFVADGVDWAHIDIAGPSFNSGEASGYLTKGGTGVPVRTLIAMVEDIAANG
ncbi:leucyl aminopeptidase [Allocatelliglobosispora scoriae]|uniref:Probable cytosol aminopeptidase n=1 Tax=Allocatelliglobosispora scoriae TaxID=643052 RepID=A0A841BMK9_9ACTN|nr:leucyl aminopeptidase [Allocatelliglobosispora scoriae]MBB5869504.1 leucyl aminopeptidase [Allocatelliglobosispora scoriae]